MSTNQGPEYFNAEKNYMRAKTNEERVFWLKEMIKNFKKHKGSENMLSNIKQRLSKFEEKQEKSKSVGKSSLKGVKKEGFQVVLLGLPNSGKSSLLGKLTNAKPKIDIYPFTTRTPEIGTMDYQGVKAQIVDLPSVGSEFFDIGIVNTADLILIVAENIQDTTKLTPLLDRAYGKKVIAINRSDLLDNEQLRKLEQTIKSKKINALVISCLTDYNLKELKEIILKSMNVIRIYTKEPGKKSSGIPVVLPVGSSVKDVAESIRKGFYLTIKETRISGPSSKFANQKIGLDHILKDLDVVEFHTR